MNGTTDRTGQRDGTTRPFVMILRPSLARRIIAAAIVALFGVICLEVLALAPPAEPVWMVVLLVAGLGALWLAWRNWRASAVGIVLHEDRIEDTEGRLLARIDEIERVERGFFAIRPANGFVLILKEKGDFAWAPGLWWRFGRRLGIGGTTPSRMAREMADVIALMLEERRKARPED